MQIFSPAFDNNQEIPEKYTCDGEEINPPLLFEDILDDTASLALVVSDPDAPQGTFTHWIVFNIDPEVRDIDEAEVPEGAMLGRNSAGKLDYVGPCPPSGIHHYIFRLYALDELLDLPEGTLHEEIIDAMEGHILETAKLVGLYGQEEV